MYRIGKRATHISFLIVFVFFFFSFFSKQSFADTTSQNGNFTSQVISSPANDQFVLLVEFLERLLVPDSTRSLAYSAQKSNGAVLGATTTQSGENNSLQNFSAPQNVPDAKIVVEEAAGSNALVQLLPESNSMRGTMKLTIVKSKSTGSLMRVIFDQPYLTNTFVTLTPANAATAALGSQMPYVTSNERMFSLILNGAPLPTGTFEWNYLVLQ